MDHCLGCRQTGLRDRIYSEKLKNMKFAEGPTPGGQGSLGREYFVKKVDGCLTQEVNSSKELKEAMQEMETQIRMIRGENYEPKTAMTHMYSLVQVINFDLRNQTTKIDEKVESLVEVMNKGCPCSTILDGKITYVHCCAIIVEAKIDNMRVDIRKLRQELLTDAGGPVDGNVGMQTQRVLVQILGTIGYDRDMH